MRYYSARGSDQILHRPYSSFGFHEAPQPSSTLSRTFGQSLSLRLGAEPRRTCERIPPQRGWSKGSGKPRPKAATPVWLPALALDVRSFCLEDFGTSLKEK
jgi:hypothetical protein